MKSITDPSKIKVSHTIDLTPTWQGIYHVIELALVNGTFEGRKIARGEMLRMAKAADLHNLSVQQAAHEGA